MAIREIFLLLTSFLALLGGRQVVVNLLLRISFLLTGKRNLAKTLYFLIFFPGVIVHELSHFLVASLLFVPTGEISLFPEGKKVGTIQVAKTDPFREALIGLAPTITGTAAILAILFLPLNLPERMPSLRQWLILLTNTSNWLWLYLVFAFSNTMFTSESDRRSFLGLLALIVLVFSSLYLFGLLSRVAGPLFYYSRLAANYIIFAYTLTFLINLVFIFPLFLFSKTIEKLTKKTT